MSLPPQELIRQAVDIAFLARTRMLHYVVGARAFQHGPLRGFHYDKPLWWETDAFLVAELEPADVVRLVREYNPGPHLIGVMTPTPEEIVPAYSALGYQTTPGEPLEIVMMRSLIDYSPVANPPYSVQVVTTEEECQFYNSAIDPDDGHCRINPEELEDRNIRYYFVEQDGLCICTARVVLPTDEAVTVEPLETHPDYRRRGIARSLMDQVHYDAAVQGAQKSVIIASTMGEKLYAALGYEIIAYIQKFVPVAPT